MLYKFVLSFIVVFLILSISLHAKNEPASNTDAIRKYYVFTNKAELAIVDSNFKQAIIHYETAFRFKSPNAKDLHNAYCASTFVQDCKRGRKYLEQLAHQGYGLAKGLSGNTAFYDCTAHGLKIVADKVNADFRSSRIGQKLDSLEKADQSVRQDEKPDREKLKLVDAAVLQSLYTFLKNEKFTDVETGMWYGNPGNDYSALWLVRWHGRGAPSILDSILRVNVLKGNYDPSVYASLMSTDNNSKYGVFYNPGRVWTDKERKSINENREKIYLESLEDYEKKMAMQMKTDAWKDKIYALYGSEGLYNHIFFKLTPDIYTAPVQ